MRAGDERLQLVQLGGAHVVELLEADHERLCQYQLVVLIVTVAVGLRVEVAPQLRGQQVVEPGGLVDALPAHQYQDLVVDHRLVECGRQDGDEPFPEEADEQLLVALDPHPVGQVGDVVGCPVPGGQPVEVVLEGVEEGDEVGAQQVVDYVDPHRPEPLVDLAPEVAVVERMEVVSRPPADLQLVEQAVAPGLGQIVDGGLDLVERGSTITPCGLCGMLVGPLVAGVYDRAHLHLAIIGESAGGPVGRLSFGDAVAVQHIAHPHDVLVVVSRLVAQSLALKYLFNLL